MIRRRPTLKLGYKRLPAPSGQNDDALAPLLDNPPRADEQSDALLIMGLHDAPDRHAEPDGTETKPET
jgi:hypothetical protein